MSGRVKEIRFGMNGEPITRTDKLVLLVLADYYSEKTGTSWPSLTTLAEECLSSKTSLWRCLSRLQNLGLLQSQNGRWNEPEYALLPFGDPPSHSNLKPESHCKTDAITFQNEQNHVSNLTENPYVSLENQVLAKREPEETAALTTSEQQTKGEWPPRVVGAIPKPERKRERVIRRLPIRFVNEEPAKRQEVSSGTRQPSESRAEREQRRLQEASEAARQRAIAGQL